MNFISVSKPSRPLALVAIGTLCQAENCSIIGPGGPGIREAAGLVAGGLQLLAGSNTCGQVFGISATPAFFSSSLLIHMTIEEELNGKESISPLAVE